MHCVCGSAECPWGEFIETCWFTPYLADLDWTNPDVVAAQVEEIAWWVERFDLDGLRVDAVPMMPRSATREIVYELQRRFERGPTTLYLVGETFGGPSSWGSIQRFLGPFGLDGQFDFPVMWSLRTTLGHGDGSLRDLATVLDESEAAWAGPDAVMAPMVGNHDVRRFLSEAAGDFGDGWTDPEWIAIDKWPKKAPKPHWSDAPQRWATPPKPWAISGDFGVEAPPGRYLLALAILDPAGMLPCVRFATANYLKGGRHPVGVVFVGGETGGPLPADFAFDDPHEDASLRYVVGG